MFKTCFERVELKYLLNEVQYHSIIRNLEDIAHIDQYGETTIMNIYYDTDDFRMIRASIEKPVYKEKLRLRTYGVPTAQSNSFVEIKKKYDGIVYKRRIAMPYDEATLFLKGNSEFDPDTQISREINYLNTSWGGLRPKMMIAYDRVAYVGNDAPDLRITFDRNIRSRTDNLDLKAGDSGKLLLPEGTYLLELKIAGAIPMNLARMFSEMGVYKSSFSKYGTAYTEFIKAQNPVPATLRLPEYGKLREGVIRYA